MRRKFTLSFVGSNNFTDLQSASAYLLVPSATEYIPSPSTFLKYKRQNHCGDESENFIYFPAAAAVISAVMGTISAFQVERRRRAVECSAV